MTQDSIIKSETKYCLGIDEAGRGPIAGPVAVSGCMVNNLGIESLSEELLEKFMRGKLKDSKKLSEKKRDEIFKWMQDMQREGKLDFTVSMGSAKTIDEKGIVPTISKAISIVLTKLMRANNAKIIEVGPLTKLGTPTIKFGEDDVHVKLDGGLKAPEIFNNQETIVRGDEREVEISLASIAAKVTRDAYMKKLGDLYNKKGKSYGFERHKGYGTKLHYETIGKHGLCTEHRRSFCKNIKE